MGSIGIKTIMGSVVHTGMRRGTVVRRRTRNRVVRGSYPAAVQSLLHLSQIYFCSPTKMN